ncbi:hypothetical protein SYJ56_04925 [Algoriphagus sp. D3-2-R+10]|uniref:hypothetical protein n=1 Tax=Algoriphagus aurantiacus TaxID=3103948 RepID=UPI002B3CD93A|nr:hypothetical protein [Algoriphagus sp. D3-2-R+10]MEB2774637.1 hypothetical protein [Algoriphagus sp. D3-2-R+10]
MKPTQLSYRNPFQSVCEFGQSKAHKFASLLQQKSEKLSKFSKYLILGLFLIISSVPSISLLRSGEPGVVTALPTEIPDSQLPYFPDLKNESTATDSLFHYYSTPQINNSHD